MLSVFQPCVLCHLQNAVFIYVTVVFKLLHNCPSSCCRSLASWAMTAVICITQSVYIINWHPWSLFEPGIVILLKGENRSSDNTFLLSLPIIALFFSPLSVNRLFSIHIYYYYSETFPISFNISENFDYFMFRFIKCFYIIYSIMHQKKPVSVSVLSWYLYWCT